MISKNEIKRIRTLHRKKGRRQEGAFLVEGWKGVDEALRSDHKVEAVYTVDGATPLKTECDLRVIHSKEMASISALASPSEHLAVVRIPKSAEVSIEALLDRRVLLLDDLSDPGNVGTIMRTADWFGIRTVLLSEQSVDVYNPKVVQATMGSIFRLELNYVDLETYLKSVKDLDPACPVIAAVMNGGPLGPLKGLERGALIIGSESHGVSQGIMHFVDTEVTIPGEQGAESLNASVAAGILMYAWVQ